MALFDWDEKLATGNAQIDAEHKQLFALAAGLHKAILEAHGHDVIGALLGKLISYTAGHFAHELPLGDNPVFEGIAGFTTGVAFQGDEVGARGNLVVGGYVARGSRPSLLLVIPTGRTKSEKKRE